MPAYEYNSKKRKFSHSGNGASYGYGAKPSRNHGNSHSYNTPAASFSSPSLRSIPRHTPTHGSDKPSATFTPQRGGRPWTVSAAVAASVLDTARTRDTHAHIVASIARAVAVFCIDEIVVFNDREASFSSGSFANDDGGFEGHVGGGGGGGGGQGGGGGTGGTDGGDFGDSNVYTADIDPAHFLVHVLAYLECPPFLRRSLFPLHRNLQLAGQMPSLDMPHHPQSSVVAAARMPYREGVSVGVIAGSSGGRGGGGGGGAGGRGHKKAGGIKGARNGGAAADETAIEKGAGTLVDVGFGESFEVLIPDVNLPNGTRVTVKMPDNFDPETMIWGSASSAPSTNPSGADGKTHTNLPVEAVAPDAPRTEGGYYWGYSVRRASSLSAVFTESPFEGGYDVSIGTSERGKPIAQAFPGAEAGEGRSAGHGGQGGPRKLNFNHLLIVFGGPRGLEYAAANDPELQEMGIYGRKTGELFDYWVNILPGQGSRTIRTEEAMFIGLTALRDLWHSDEEDVRNL